MKRPNRDELSLRTVLAFPAGRGGLSRRHRAVVRSLRAEAGSAGGTESYCVPCGESQAQQVVPTEAPLGSPPSAYIRVSI